ncbi:HD domain-containing protein [Deinococcus peraridilitoris]|uniref:Putative HD superfamily hydrolase n=1 Tax=Deinococcus peraridilitoris (strain DSM 19664 / LMG 22246 / CIP 109416 / KR-200) TaxID=937777 RepID=L0A1Q8_DEIPD|nr:HD domain-containing protein [Deinococcus peraridilitoris]AFZ66950.1 putative HD superfamily hydrolase [Deinococcus peraridilitoris DSM 19664]
MEHLDTQVDFLLTCDKLKTVLRSTLLHDGSRTENSAEHSWHLALTALTLGEYAPPGTNIGRVVELLIVHDLVEIYAGDTHFDTPDQHLIQVAEKEREAAEKLFGILSSTQERYFRSLWDEFEAWQTVEARFARALDALQPMLLTWGKGGRGSAAHPELTARRVLQLKHKYLREFPEFWQLAQRIIGEAVQAGIMQRDAAAIP